jgi:hypothetical protein
MMEPSPSSTHKKLARYYNGLGFGINVYLRSHIDRNFTMSIVQVHINNHNYQVDDRISCYFAFPGIGTAVALQPGDFLLLNPQELHSISSCCKSGDKIFCISSYLKTGVVGLNDLYNPATSSDFDLKHPLRVSWRNLSKRAEKSSSSPRTAGVFGNRHVMCCCVSFLVAAGNSF